jgi:hypothetical protein
MISKVYLQEKVNFKNHVKVDRLYFETYEPSIEY